MKKRYLVGITIIGILVICLVPYMSGLMKLLISPELISTLKKFVDWAGAYGIVVVFLLQILQVIVAIIPSEPVEIIAGAMLGPVYGPILCFVGLFVANAIVFLVVRHFGREWLRKQKIYEKLEKMPYFSNSYKLKRTIFVLYLIPATPKDIFVYACALTNIGTLDFLLLSTLPRIPSIVSSTLMGSNLLGGNFLLTAIIFAITLVFGLFGIAYHDHKYGSGAVREK